MNILLDNSGALSGAAGVIIGAIIAITGNVVVKYFDYRGAINKNRLDLLRDIYKVKNDHLNSLIQAASRFYAICQAGEEESGSLDPEANELYFKIVSLIDPDDPSCVEIIELLSQIRLSWDSEHEAFYESILERKIAEIVARERKRIESQLHRI